MLQNFRKIADTWVGRIIGIFLLLGLAGFGATGLLTSAGSNTLARVGNQDVSAQDFQRAYQVQLQNFAQQLGTFPTAQQAQAFGLPSSVVSQLASNAALNGLAQNMGLGVSEQRLVQDLQDNPSFGGTLGSFDADIFRQSLQRSGLTEAQYFEDRANAAGREQLAMGIFNNGFVPETARALAHKFGEDRRIVDFVELTDADLLPIGEPTPEELAEYLSVNQTRYRTPELREVDILVLSTELLGQRYSFSDEEIAAEYDRVKATLIVPERRSVEQVILADEAQVTLFQEGLNSGRDFNGLVLEAELTANSLGSVVQGELSDPSLDELAFSLGAGEFAMLDGVSGQRAVYVSSVTAGGTPALNEVEEDLIARLRTSKAREDFTDVLDQIEELRAGFVSAADIGAQFDLPVTSIAVSANGSELREVEGLAAEEQFEVAGGIFEAEIGKLAPTLFLGLNKNAWFDLQSEIESRDQSVEEVGDQLAEDWNADARSDALAQRAANIAKAVADNEVFADVAVNFGLFPQISSAFPRAGLENGPINGSVANAAFSGGVGHSGFSVTPNGGYVIFKVSQVLDADGEIDPERANVIAQAFYGTSFAAFTQNLLNDAGMSVNQELLDQLIGLSPAPGVVGQTGQ